MSENKRQWQKWLATVRNVRRPKSRDSHASPSGRPNPITPNPIKPIAISPSSSHTETKRTETASTDPPVPHKSETHARLGVPESPPESERHAPDVYGDRKRTERRYEKAVQRLDESLKLKFRGANWQSFEVPKFNDIIQNDPLPQMREDIEKMLNAREESIQDRGFWSRNKKFMEEIFSAISPITKNLLTIAKEGSAVYCVIISS